jgi:hypothetical protein
LPVRFRNAQPDQRANGFIGWAGAIGTYIRISNPARNIVPLSAAIGQEPSNQPPRADGEVDAVGVHLRPDEDGVRQAVQRLGRKVFPASRERGRGVPEPLLHWRAVRNRIQDFDGIGEERAQTIDDQRFDMGRREPRWPCEVSAAVPVTRRREM